MTLSESILATLAYHDIFDYPLTLEEIHKYLIGKKASLKSISSVILERSHARGGRSDRISNKDNLFALKKRQKLFAIRKQRFKYSQLKLKRTHLFSSLLSLIPTIKLVAVSGALAMNNSHQKDDIDLFIVTAKNTLWSTRFFANVILSPFKRKPAPPLTINHSPLTNNRACLNIFIDETSLEINPKNLYIAHEICQMKPIQNRDKTYSRFIKANRWVSKFLPNWRSNVERPASPAKRGELTTNAKSQKTKKTQALVFKRLALVVEPLEALAKWGQLWYMRPKITTERIGKTQLFFHPANTGGWVLNEYKKRLKKLKIM